MGAVLSLRHRPARAQCNADGALSMPGITPSATVGPFFLFGLVPSSIGGTDVISNNLVTPDASGERIGIEGCVLDGDGIAVADAMIEIWQADAAGRYASAADGRALSNTAFKGF